MIGLLRTSVTMEPGLLAPVASGEARGELVLQSGGNSDSVPTLGHTHSLSSPGRGAALPFLEGNGVVRRLALQLHPHIILIFLLLTRIKQTIQPGSPNSLLQGLKICICKTPAFVFLTHMLTQAFIMCDMWRCWEIQRWACLISWPQETYFTLNKKEMTWVKCYTTSVQQTSHYLLITGIWNVASSNWDVQ